ncbi:MAG TPA: hypothetical protein VI011_16465 [Asanoa sp.]
MTTPVTEQEIRAYADAVRRALADLPAKTRDELLDDLPDHLAEVAAEGEGTLVDRLGSPAAYAAEVRAAAGLRGPGPTGRSIDDRLIAAWGDARDRLRVADRKLGPAIGYRSLSDYLRLLRPAWWVVRGYLAAMVVAVITTGSAVGLLPRLGGSTLAAILILGMFVPASIWFGRREHRLARGPRFVVGLATAFLVLFGVVGLLNVRSSGYGGGGEVYQPTYGNPLDSVQDVFVYDEQGNPLTNVRLFDQDGQPIRIGYPGWCQTAEVGVDPRPVEAQPAYPYCPDRAPYRIGPRAGVAADPTPTPSAAASVTATPAPRPSRTG